MHHEGASCLSDSCLSCQNYTQVRKPHQRCSTGEQAASLTAFSAVKTEHRLGSQTKHAHCGRKLPLKHLSQLSELRSGLKAKPKLHNVGESCLSESCLSYQNFTLGGFNIKLFWNFIRNQTANDRFCKINTFLLQAKCFKMCHFLSICV